jgi:DNA-binding NtrC family response regulator
LLVDPDADQQRQLAHALGSVGHAVVAAATAGSALEQLRDGGIDMAIVHYTGGVQLEAFATGLSRLPDPPPYLLLSAEVDGPTMSARFGAVEFVARPVRAEELMRLVDRILAGRSTPQTFDDVPTRPNERKPPTF